MNYASSTAELVSTLRDIEELLVQQGELVWAKRIRQTRYSVEDVGESSASYVMAMFRSGMGTFDDLVLHKDGRWLTDENDQLHALKGRAWALAVAMRDGNSEPSA